MKKWLCLVVAVLLIVSGCGFIGTFPLDELLESSAEPTAEPVEDAEKYEINYIQCESFFNYLQIVGEIENISDQDIIISTVAVDIKDKDGNIIKKHFTMPFPTLIEPGEKAHICDPTTDIELEKGDVYIAEVASVGCYEQFDGFYRLSVENVEVKKSTTSEFRTICTGEVINTTGVAMEKVFPTVTLFDSNGVPCAQRMLGEFTDGMDINEKVSFEMEVMHGVPFSALTEYVITVDGISEATKLTGTGAESAEEQSNDERLHEAVDDFLYSVADLISFVGSYN